uniref:Uncharacterized protein n=1 Tax=Anguilla anguilla TaxID=7936 RepID=A0A0E9QU45_ANGAN
MSRFILIFQPDDGLFIGFDTFLLRDTATDSKCLESALDLSLAFLGKDTQLAKRQLSSLLPHYFFSPKMESYV